MICAVHHKVVRISLRSRLKTSTFTFYLSCFSDARAVVNKDRIEAMRDRVTTNLEDYINDRQYDARGRFRAMLIILPNLLSITLQMIDLIQHSRQYEGTKVDNLLQEMLLGGEWKIGLNN